MTDENYGLGGSELAFDGPTQDEIVPQFLDECRLGGHYLRPALHALHRGLLRQQDLRGKAGLHPARHPDLGLCVAGVGGGSRHQGAPTAIYSVNGQEVLIPFIYKSTDNMMIQMLRQKDAGYSTETGEIQLFNDTTKDLLLDIADHTAKRGLLHLQDLGLPGQLPERRTVHLCGGLHGGLHLDGLRRAPGGHCRGGPGEL